MNWIMNTFAQVYLSTHRDALSLASADYVGQLQLPYIAVVANGKYNSATERIIFNTALELTLQV